MSNNKPNAVFWIISIIALLWNGMGILRYLGMTVWRDETMATLTDELKALVEALPSWMNYVFAVAVFAGFLGVLLMLLRRKLATPLLGISLLAVLVQMGYWLFATEIIDVEGVQGAIMPIVVIAVAIFLYFYSKGAAQKGWLR